MCFLPLSFLLANGMTQNYLPHHATSQPEHVHHPVQTKSRPVCNQINNTTNAKPKFSQTLVCVYSAQPLYPLQLYTLTLLHNPGNMRSWSQGCRIWLAIKYIAEVALRLRNVHATNHTGQPSLKQWFVMCIQYPGPAFEKGQCWKVEIYSIFLLTQYYHCPTIPTQPMGCAHNSSRKNSNGFFLLLHFTRNIFSLKIGHFSLSKYLT